MGPVPCELSEDILAELYAHAVREYPRECCGLVFRAAGDGRLRAAAVRNIQDELHAEEPAKFPRDARTAYHLEASGLFALHRSLDGAEPAVIVYHSHCDAGAYFSATDQEAAQLDGGPTYPVEHVVIDVTDGEARGAVQLAWDEAARRYVEVRSYRAAQVPGIRG